MIDDIVHKKCLSSTIMLPANLDTNQINEYVKEIQRSYSKLSLKNTVLMIRQDNSFLLFGLADSVNGILSEHETVKQQHAIRKVQLNLQYHQVCAIKTKHISSKEFNKYSNRDE